MQLVVADTGVAADANEGSDSKHRVELSAAVGLPVVAEACGNDCESHCQYANLQRRRCL